MSPKGAAPPPPCLRASSTGWLAIVARVVVLTYCHCLGDAFGKLFEPKSKKIARLTAELAALEAERLSKLVVVFGYEFDKLGFYTSVSLSTVLFVASIIQLWQSRRKWKRLALSSSGPGLVRDPTAAKTRTAPYAIVLVLCTTILFLSIAFNDIKPLKWKSISSLRSPLDKSLYPQSHSSSVILFGEYADDKTTFFVSVSTVVALLVAGAQIGNWCRQLRKLPHKVDENNISGATTSTKEKTLDSPEAKTLDVIIVGCGPKSVGWFHLMQFLDMPSINVLAVVEPFYLDKTKCPYPPQSFVDLVMMLDEMDIRCFYDISQIKALQQKTLCVIAGRTQDNPRFFHECIDIGASHLYLESPGAPDVEQLEDMQSLAMARGITVYMGYQRLCASYIEETVLLSCKMPESHVFFCHNETHPSKELHFVASQFPEGMIHSMAAQELAVLVAEFDVKFENVQTFKVNSNRLFSEKTVFYNESTGNKLVDFSRVAFKITTTKGRNVSIMADRCGGLVSFAVVKNHTGQELQRFESHDREQALLVQDELRKDKEIMDQFTIESDEYLELKKRVVKNILTGDRSSGLVPIQCAIDVMTLADYCTSELNAALEADD